jgi:hypothetical protein
VLWLALSAVTVSGQTQVDLQTQSKRVDFTQAPMTAPVKAGATLPAACTVGQLFYDTDAPAGQNLYGCTAVDTWSLQGGTGGVSSVSGTANEINATTSAGAVTLSLPATVNLGSKTALELPHSGVPITNSFGRIAGDENAWGPGRGSIQFYDGTSNTYVVAVLASDVPTDGQVPVWNNGGTVTWETVTGSGVTDFSQLTDLKVTRAASTYTIAGGSAAFGDVTTTFSAATLTESDPDDSGTIYFCVEYNNGSPRLLGVIPAAFTEANYAASGLTVEIGSGCPEDSRTLATALMTAGTPENPVSFRPAVSVAPALVAGSGLLRAVGNGGRSRTLSIDTTSIVQKFTGAGTPSGTVTGSTLGDLYVDTAAERAYMCMNPAGNCSGVAAGQWVILN